MRNIAIILITPHLNNPTLLLDRLTSDTNFPSSSYAFALGSSLSLSLCFLLFRELYIYIYGSFGCLHILS